jgi:hypothetical protein
MPERYMRDWDFSNKEPETSVHFLPITCYGVSQEEINFNNKVPGTTPRPFHDHQPHK